MIHPSFRQCLVVVVSIVVAAPLVLLGCYAPMTSEMAVQISDAVAPDFVVTWPINHSEYSTVVRVEGVARDADGPDSVVGSYVVQGTPIQGSFDIASDGAFSFLFVTRDSGGTDLVAGPFTLELSVTDWNGNVSRTSVHLVPPDGEDGDVPGFNVEAGNRRVVISWDNVPGASHYVVHAPYLGESVADVQSPYEWAGLENGVTYGFRVQGVIDDAVGSDAWSGMATVMPMSPLTLAPSVTNIGYRTVSIDWNSVAGVDDYIVERREGNDPWTVHTITNESSLVDRDLEHDTTYSYRVTPMTLNQVPSLHASAVPGRFGFPGFDGYVPDVQGAIRASIADSTVYVPALESGLAVIDIRDPIDPGPVSFAATPGQAHDVVVVGTIAYVADGDAGLSIVDVSDIAHPVLISNKGVDGEALGLTVRESTAFVASQGGGLTIIDVSDSLDPQVLSAATGITGAFDVKVDGGWAFVAAGESGLAMVNVSDLLNPEPPTFVPINHGAIAVSLVNPIFGRFALLAGGDDGIVSIDVTSPLSPGPPEYMDLNGSATDIEVTSDERWAYVALEDVGLAKVWVGWGTPWDLRIAETWGGAVGVAVSGSIVCTVGAFGMAVYDMAQHFDSWATTYSGFGGAGTALAVADGLAYLASDGRVRVIDISVPHGPVLLGSSDPIGTINDIEVVGQILFVANGDGVTAIDVATPTDPSFLDSVDTPGAASGLAASGEHLFVADYGSGVTVIDISNPAALSVGAVGLLSGTPHDVVVAGSHLYVAGLFGELVVLSIADPEEPFVQARVPLAAWAESVAFRDPFVYVACNDAGLAVIDVTNPASPSPPVYWATSGKAIGVDLAGSYAYVSSWGNGIDVFNISNPETLGDPDTLMTSNTNLYQVAVAGSVLYFESQEGLGVTTMR